MAELVALWAVGLASDRALAVQVTAPSPWGEFHDLRWAMVLPDSWINLGLEAAGIWAGRTLIDTLIVRWAWPTTPPRFWPHLARQAVFTLVVLVLLLPWVTIAFGVSVVSISWLFFAAVPPVVVVAVVVHHGPATGAWWHGLPPARSVGLTFVTFIVDSLTGLVLGVLPAAFWVPVVLMAGIFNAWAWRGIIRAVVHRVPRLGRVPVAPLVTVGMVGAAALGTFVAFQVVTVPHVGRRSAEAAGIPGPGPGSPARRTPVLIISGFDSSLTGATPRPIPGPYDEVRYSYLGLDGSGRPLPFPAAATHQSVRHLAGLLAAQVSALHRTTGRPVDIVAESEGALLARVYLAAERSPPVDRVVLLSPLDGPARVFYPGSGRQGYGMLSVVGLQVLTGTLGALSPVDLSADSPLLRSIVDHPGALRGLLACPTGPVTETLVEPLADAVTDPVPPATEVPTLVVSAFHGGLLADHGADTAIGELLAGRRVTTSPSLGDMERSVRLAASAWQVPALPQALYAPGPDDPSCAVMTTAVRRWIPLPP